MSSHTSSLTPSRSSSPVTDSPVQPDHFFSIDTPHVPPSPSSDGRTWFDPEEDPLAHRGIPVFKPTMQEFADFEGYMNKVEVWGMHSGIVKVIPPKEWTESLPSVKAQLAKVKIKSPIEQHMLGRAGLFRQENLEKRRVMSVREWAELCAKEDLRAPGVEEVGLHARSQAKPKATRRGKKKADTESVERELDDSSNITEEHADADSGRAVIEFDTLPISLPTKPQESESQSPNESPAHPTQGDPSTPSEEQQDEETQKSRSKRAGPTREAREAQQADRTARDAAFIQTFDPTTSWLPPQTNATDYTPEFCQKLERQYWRNCGLGKPAWYGADTQGSLYTEDTKTWNVAKLPSLLSRILPVSAQGLPGVNTPYLYFGMWRATFAWHVEDMDLFSINYIHFGAPKFWYAIPQGRAGALEQTMKGYFPKDTSQCPQFLRHKSFLASPTLLAQSSCRPNVLVQQAGEFVITFPRGYHAGFNLGFNCAESVNFALESWVEMGRKARICQCVGDSVRIDVDQLLQDRETERQAQKEAEQKKKRAPKRKSEGGPSTSQSQPKRPKKEKPSTSISVPPGSSTSSTSKFSITLKLKPPTPPDGLSTSTEPFPCCLCVSTSPVGLLRVHDPPVGRKELPETLVCLGVGAWRAHEECARIVPETWVDEIERDVSVDVNDSVVNNSEVGKEKVVFGVDVVVRDRWNLKCSFCTRSLPKAHGAPIQCTKGKCAKSFHVSCAKEGAQVGIVWEVVREVEKEVVLLDSPPPVPAPLPVSAQGLPHDDVAMGEEGGVGSEGNIAEVPMQVDQPHNAGPVVLKTIKKLEVQVLCTQHNPAIAAAKKATKQDKIRSSLTSLPAMTRIKIRVSAGVFEVSLVRVIEETKSVEVIWDKGVKREFKWGAVVFGDVGGVRRVEEGTTEPVPALPVPTAPVTMAMPVTADNPPSTSQAQPSSSSLAAAVPATPHHNAHQYPQYNYMSGSWAYNGYHQPAPAVTAPAMTHPGTTQAQVPPISSTQPATIQPSGGSSSSSSSTLTQPPYAPAPAYSTYPGYYHPASLAVPYSQPQTQPAYTPAAYASAYTPQFRPTLQWTQPYRGPGVAVSTLGEVTYMSGLPMGSGAVDKAQEAVVGVGPVNAGDEGEGVPGG